MNKDQVTKTNFQFSIMIKFVLIAVVASLITPLIFGLVNNFVHLEAGTFLRSIVNTLILAVTVACFTYLLIIRRLKIITHVVQQISKGNFSTKEIQIRGNDELGKLSAAINEIIFNLGDLMDQLQDVAHKNADIADELSARAQTTSSMNQEQSANTEELSSTFEEISAMSQQTAANSEGLTKSAESVAEDSTAGLEMVEDTTDRIESVNNTIQSLATDINNLNGTIQEVTEFT
ncbi:MAG: methyl-accepting chemotaxis protein, partial [Bacillota bacterium]